MADELIVSRAGVRLRVGNTDAEGTFGMKSIKLLTLALLYFRSNGHGGHSLVLQGEGGH